MQDLTVKEKGQAALQRQATADGKSIHIDTSDSKVTLTGHASSWQSIEDATNAAWAAPGVTEVVDHVKMSMTLGIPRGVFAAAYIPKHPSHGLARYVRPSSMTAYYAALAAYRR